MAYCENCGNPLGDNAQFCVKCGTKRHTGEPVPQPGPIQNIETLPVSPQAQQPPPGGTQYPQYEKGPTTAQRGGSKLSLSSVWAWFRKQSKPVQAAIVAGIVILIIIGATTESPDTPTGSNPSGTTTTELSPEQRLSNAEAKLQEYKDYKATVLAAFGDSDAYAKRLYDQLQAGDMYKAYETADKGYWVNFELATEKLPKIKPPKEMKLAHDKYGEAALFRQNAMRAFVKAVDANGKTKLMKQYKDNVEFAFSALTSATAEMTTVIVEQEKKVEELKISTTE